jgi:tetratricopeptide (TPR) repeat protein
VTEDQKPTAYGTLSNFWFASRPILLIGLLIFFSLYTNEAVIQYRMDEYNRAMEALSQSYNSSHALNMLARFDLINKRQAQPDEAADEDETALELKLQSLTTGKLLAGETKKADLQTRAIEMVIRGVGFILGKKRGRIEVPGSVQQNLEAAYFYERSRKYEKAIGVYSEGLSDQGLGFGVAATLLLHRGFCYALMGNYAKAMEDFRQTERQNPDSEEARVAAKLLELTQALEDQVRLARQTPQTPFQSARALFRLANYSDAAQILQKVLSDPATGEQDKLEGRYLYARSQEEMGEDSDAVTTYRSLMQEAPNSAFAKKANRRLYVLGKYYSHDEDLAQTALKKIEQYQDFKFINSLKSLEVAKPKEAIAPNPNAPGPVDEVPTPAEHGATKLDKLDKIDKVDVGDLRGEEKAKREAAAGKAEAEKLTATLKKDVTVKHAAAKIAADPLRQEAIFSTIQSNQGELEFVYQKWLRKGTVFEGNLTIRMLIQPDGSIRDAKIVSEKSTIDNPTFSAEILQNIKKWRFREDPNATGDIPVSFPLSFVNKQ